MWMTSLCLAFNTTPFILVVCVYVRIPDPSVQNHLNVEEKVIKQHKCTTMKTPPTENHPIMCFFFSDSTQQQGQVKCQQRKNSRSNYTIFFSSLISYPFLIVIFFFFCTFQLFSYFSLLTLPSNVKHTHIPQIE